MSSLNGLNQRLSEAIYAADVARCRELIALGADVNSDVAADGTSKLHAAASRGEAAICILLIENGAKPDAQTESGLTPLHFAAMSGHQATCVALLERGADLEAEDEDHRTPLHLASRRQSPAFCQFLAGLGEGTKKSRAHSPF